MSTEQIVAFCRRARAQGFSAGVTETLGSLEAVRAVPDTDPETAKCVLRAAICSSKDEWDLFDSLFEAFWTAAASKTPATDPKCAQPAAGADSVILDPFNDNPGDTEDGKSAAGASARERLKKMDFSEVPNSDQAALEQLARRLLRQAGIRLARRLKIAASRNQIDLRRTIRTSVATGGDPIEIRYKGRKPTPARLVIFLDVSGSMSHYSLFLLRFAHALEKHLRRTGTFIFSTNVVDITVELRSRQLADALRAVSHKYAGWSGGTRIGESLREFNRLHGRRSLSRDTLLIMLSDGWDTGEPEVLASELRAIKRRIRKLVWLNPLLGLENYQPVTRGMAAALPYIDVFRPAHCLESLLQLETAFR